MNPNGIPSQSPGLRGTSYPGSRVPRLFPNPNGVASSATRRFATTPLGLTNILESVPRVVAPLQPWAEGHCPVGAKPAQPATDTSAFEREIDQQVYALYGLTPEEIKIVEDSAK